MLEISLSSDVIMRERDIYNALDFIGDVGGLKEGLMNLASLCFFILSFAVNNPLSRHLVQRIF